jgi:hypothetical protein
MNIRYRIHKTPLPLFFVDLVPAPNNKDIYEIKYIQNMLISVEPPRKNNSIIQCTRCQSYGHSKTDCRKPFRLLKCAGDHNTNTCTKLRTTPATCALCGGEHTANYKDCDIYQKLQAKRRGDKTPSPRPGSQEATVNIQHSTRYDSSTEPNTTKRTYAHVTARHHPNPIITLQTLAGSSHYSERSLSHLLSRFESTFQQLMNQNSVILSLLSRLVTSRTP